MPRLSHEFSRLGSNLGDAAKAFVTSPVNAVRQVMGKGAYAAEATATTTAAASKTPLLLQPMKWSAKGALRLVELPFAYGMKAVNYGVGAIGGAYKKAPLIMFPLTIIGAAVGIKGYKDRREEKMARQERVAQLQALETAMVESRLPQEPTATANTTYQISPQEYAAMQAQMRGGDGAPRANHADSVMAARQQQTQQQAVPAV